MYRRWIDPLLRDAAKEAEASKDERKKLHTSLALLPVNGVQVGYLFRRLLEAEPHEVPVIRDALAPHQDELLDKLWAVAEAPGKQRLRAASALAKYDPESERWARVQDAVGNDLVKVPSVYLPIPDTEFESSYAAAPNFNGLPEGCEGRPLPGNRSHRWHCREISLHINYLPLFSSLRTPTG